jgi:ABC-type enterochelin transport system substrate-binding protein
MTPADAAAQENHKDITNLLRVCEEEARAEANLAKMEKAFLEAKELSKTSKASHAKALKVRGPERRAYTLAPVSRRAR